MTSLLSILGWTVDTLDSVRENLRAERDAVAQAHTDMAALPGFLGTEWSGIAADAAATHFSYDSDSLRSLEQIVGDYTSALAEFKSAIEHPVHAIQQICIRAAELGVGIEADGLADPGANASDESRTFYADARADVERDLAIIRAADTDHARTLDQISERLSALDPRFATAPGRDASADIRDLTNGDGSIDAGDVSNDELASVVAELARIGLNPQQNLLLAGGGSIPGYPARDMAYLRDLYNGLGHEGFMRLLERAGNSPNAQWNQQALSNEMLILTNENIGTGDTRGGLDQLPAASQGILRNGVLTRTQSEFREKYYNDRERFRRDHADLMINGRKVEPAAVESEYDRQKRELQDLRPDLRGASQRFENFTAALSLGNVPPGTDLSVAALERTAEFTSLHEVNDISRQRSTPGGAPVMVRRRRPGRYSVGPRTRQPQ